MAWAARSKPLLLARLSGAQQLHTDVPVYAERARTILGMEGPVRCAHIESGLPGTFPAARAVGGGTAVRGRPGEGAVLYLACCSSGVPQRRTSNVVVASGRLRSERGPW